MTATRYFWRNRTGDYINSKKIVLLGALLAASSCAADGGIVYRTVVPEPVDKAGELRFDAGRLLMERYPFKTLTVEDNLKGLREGMVPDYAVANVVKWLELMGVDMSEYRRPWLEANRPGGLEVSISDLRY